jgi:hypothetical protein
MSNSNSKAVNGGSAHSYITPLQGTHKHDAESP